MPPLHEIEETAETKSVMLQILLVLIKIVLYSLLYFSVLDIFAQENLVIQSYEFDEVWNKLRVNDVVYQKLNECRIEQILLWKDTDENALYYLLSGDGL